MKYVFFIILLMFFLGKVERAFAQDQLWRPVSVQEKHSTKEENLLFELNENTLKETLNQVGEVYINKPPIIFSLPTPDGTFTSFQIIENRVFEKEFSNNIPHIKTYEGIALNDPRIKVKLDTSSLGFHAFVLGIEHSYTIQPRGGHLYELCPLRYEQFNCLTENKTSITSAPKSASGGFGGELLIYKLALTASGEYTLFWGGFDNTLAAMASTVNQLNAIFERDLGVRFELADETRFLIYQNPDFDPFAFDGNQNVQNQLALDQNLNSEDYDIGHLLMTGGNIGNQGLAFVGSVCDDRTKGSAFSILADPSDYSQVINILAHELGHQLGGNHSFSHCDDFQSGILPVEPGSGSTIMAYGGLEICGSDNFVDNSSDYFHGVNIEEIGQFLRSPDKESCPLKAAFFNSFSTIDISQNERSIPISTPFELDGIITNPDGDSLTFCWEQVDQAAQLPLGLITGGSPMFRSYPPKRTSIRSFPVFERLIIGENRGEEILPNFATPLNFRLTVRDNNPDVGSVNWEEVTVQVTDNAGPFRVITAEEPLSWDMGSTQEINWEVANTNLAPVNATNVEVFLVLDSLGENQILIAENLPNTGAAAVEIPFFDQDQSVWLKIKASNNLFYNISNSNIELKRTTPTSSMDLEERNLVSIFPNPTSGHLQINFDPKFDATIEIFDLTGRLIWHQEISNTIIQLPETLPKGTYLSKITLIDDNRKTTYIRKMTKI